MFTATKGDRMALVSKTEAAILAGITRPTFYRHISKGKVSVVNNNDGTQSIDTAELLRVYGELQSGSNTVDVKKLNDTIRHDTPKNVNIELMEYKIEQLEKQLAESKAQNDKFLNIIETQTIAIEHIKAPGFWDRVFGKSK